MDSFYREMEDARQEHWELMDVEFDLEDEEMDEDQLVLRKLQEFGFDDEDDLTEEEEWWE